MPLSDPEFRRLSRRVYLDVLVDTLGNLILCLGLYLAFSENARHFPLWLQTPEAKGVLVATGLMNLRFLGNRIRRLRLWQAERRNRNSP
ncbi:MAG TPA: hypothetical protein VFW49_07760 [Fluviicoccus sp.]|nr:hypothetical protein [Fluviicoccus sp.]